MQQHKRIIMVGDNPFQGVSHVSQKKAVMRGRDVTQPQVAADLVRTALEHGATAFTFTISDVTLALLRHLKKDGVKPPLYAFAPYAYEYVRLATKLGGTPGLAKHVAFQIIRSGNLRALLYGASGLLTVNPAAAYKAYVEFELSRVRSEIDNLKCLFLHQVVTDMALALNMEWIVRSHIDVLRRHDILPGFHTFNLPLLVNRMRGWNIAFTEILISAPFNALGMQMNPSKTEAEKALQEINCQNVLAFGVLAGGLLGLEEALKYIDSLPNIMGIALGVSRKEQAVETFKAINSI